MRQMFVAGSDIADIRRCTGLLLNVRFRKRRVRASSAMNPHSSVPSVGRSDVGYAKRPFEGEVWTALGRFSASQGPVLQNLLPDQRPRALRTCRSLFAY